MQNRLSLKSKEPRLSQNVNKRIRSSQAKINRGCQAGLSGNTGSVKMGLDRPGPAERQWAGLGQAEQFRPVHRPDTNYTKQPMIECNVS